MSRIWTGFINSISYNNNHYTKHTSKWLQHLISSKDWHIVKPTNQPTLNFSTGPLIISCHLFWINVLIILKNDLYFLSFMSRWELLIKLFIKCRKRSLKKTCVYLSGLMIPGPDGVFCKEIREDGRKWIE